MCFSIWLHEIFACTILHLQVGFIDSKFKPNTTHTTQVSWTPSLLTRRYSTKHTIESHVKELKLQLMHSKPKKKTELELEMVINMWSRMKEFLFNHCYAAWCIYVRVCMCRESATLVLFPRFMAFRFFYNFPYSLVHSMRKLVLLKDEQPPNIFY